MIAELFVAGTAGVLDLLHRRPQIAGLVGLDLADRHQLTGGGFQGAGQLLETRLLAPDVIGGAAVILLLDLGEVLPRLMGQAIKLHRPLGKTRTVERNPPPQHAPQVLAGLEHLLEDRLALAQGRIGIDTATGGKRQAGQQYNRKSF